MLELIIDKVFDFVGLHPILTFFIIGGIMAFVYRMTVLLCTKIIDRDEIDYKE